MPEEHEPAPDEPPARRRISRRALIGGAIGVVAVAAVGGGGAFVLPRLLKGAEDGLLVPELVKRAGFTVAHRGGSRDWPEMSLEAYRNSVALGVNALEMSLARTSDGVWFGLHDATLDRTSGTSGFVAADHTWKEVQRYRITAAGTDRPGQAPQPYLRFEDLVAAYGTTHTIFVDPKVVPTEHLGELFTLMAKVENPTRTFVAKGYCTAQAWPVDARARGYQTWGYYYGAELAADPELYAKTQARWTWLGLDYQGGEPAWAQFTASGKPVLAHIVPTRAAADTALRLGANGLVVSGVQEVLKRD
ncbi:glycerophosphodiester phosphodiesterase family protein [Leifsonia sp. NPDC077715]|uniref:glycerophosphodiester phosphodiesterase n=1 Tax=Leifsonia sp. NPDC077715 TaxID=3155539 RepID=UPI00341DCC83